MTGSSPKIYWADKILEKTILKLIPYKVSPNEITIARFILTPFVLWHIFYENWAIALILFAITASTDMIDGAMARTRNKITQWGQIYDPLADKLLIGLTLVALVYKFTHPYLFFTIISLELILIAMTYIGKKFKIKDEINSNVWGKIKMILQCFGIGFILLWLIFPLTTFITIAYALLVISVVFAVISIITYGI